MEKALLIEAYSQCQWSDYKRRFSNLLFECVFVMGLLKNRSYELRYEHFKLRLMQQDPSKNGLLKNIKVNNINIDNVNTVHIKVFIYLLAPQPTPASLPIQLNNEPIVIPDSPTRNSDPNVPGEARKDASLKGSDGDVAGEVAAADGGGSAADGGGSGDVVSGNGDDGDGGESDGGGKGGGYGCSDGVNEGTHREQGNSLPGNGKNEEAIVDFKGGDINRIGSDGGGKVKEVNENNGGVGDGSGDGNCGGDGAGDGGEVNEDDKEIVNTDVGSAQTTEDSKDDKQTDKQKDKMAELDACHESLPSSTPPKGSRTYFLD